MENNICFSALVDSVGNRAHQRVSPICASKSRHQRLCKSVSYLSFRNFQHVRNSSGCERYSDMYLLYAFYSCRSVPWLVDIWRILLSLSRFCRADFRNCPHGQQCAMCLYTFESNIAYTVTIECLHRSTLNNHRGLLCQSVPLSFKIKSCFLSRR